MNVEQIEARANAATPGPWVAHENGERICRVRENGEHDAIVTWPLGGRDNSEEDAAFIAHARTDMPALIADWRATRAELQRVRELFSSDEDRDWLDGRWPLGMTRDAQIQARFAWLESVAARIREVIRE